MIFWVLKDPLPEKNSRKTTGAHFSGISGLVTNWNCNPFCGAKSGCDGRVHEFGDRETTTGYFSFNLCIKNQYRRRKKVLKSSVHKFEHIIKFCWRFWAFWSFWMFSDLLNLAHQPTWPNSAKRKFQWNCSLLTSHINLVAITNMIKIDKVLCETERPSFKIETLTQCANKVTDWDFSCFLFHSGSVFQTLCPT